MDQNLKCLCVFDSPGENSPCAVQSMRLSSPRSQPVCASFTSTLIFSIIIPQVYARVRGKHIFYIILNRIFNNGWCHYISI